jgi:hypothetical protein
LVLLLLLLLLLLRVVRKMRSRIVRQGQLLARLLVLVEMI